MNHTEILKKSWKILWNYKTLWIFGILLAFTSGGGGGGGGGNYNLPRQSGQGMDFKNLGKFGPQLRNLENWFEKSITSDSLQWIAAVIIFLVCLAFLFGLVFTVLRLVSRVALIRMVDHYDRENEKVSWRAGFKFGWSRSAFRLFLIDLLISVPLVLLFLILFTLAALPLIISAVAGGEPSTVAIVATVGLALLVLLLVILTGVLISIVLQVIWRECVLEQRGVVDSIKSGWGRFVHNIKDVVIMWLILLGLQFGFGILMIPVVLILLFVGALFGGGVGLILYLAGQAVSDNATLVPAVILGALILIALLALPMIFISGLKETFLSSSWTLAYRQISDAPKPEADLSEITPADSEAKTGDLDLPLPA